MRSEGAPGESMVTGHNVNVRAGGRVYHVQTEDKGRSNPIIETLVYLEGGKIIHQERQSYAESNDDHSYHAATIKMRLDAQHQRLVEAVKAGVFDPDRKLFGEEFMTDRSLDECVAAWLDEQAREDSLALEYVSHQQAARGAAASLTVKAVLQGSGAPVAGLTIHAKLLSVDGSPTPLGSVLTDAEGLATVSYSAPPEGTASAAVIVQAESDAGRDELAQFVR